MQDVRLEESVGRQSCASSSRNNQLEILGAFRMSATAGLRLSAQVNVLCCLYIKAGILLADKIQQFGYLKLLEEQRSVWVFFFQSHVRVCTRITFTFLLGITLEEMRTDSFLLRK